MTVKHQFIANSVTILKQNAKEKDYLIIKPQKITEWNKTAIHNLNNDFCPFSEKNGHIRNTNEIIYFTSKISNQRKSKMQCTNQATS